MLTGYALPGPLPWAALAVSVLLKNFNLNR